MCEERCCGHVKDKKDMNMHHGGCHSGKMHRHFLTREEKTEMLEKYVEELEKEIKGAKQKIQELKS